MQRQRAVPVDDTYGIPVTVLAPANDRHTVVGPGHKSAVYIRFRIIDYTKKYKKKMFDNENENQGHGLQHSQWRHSIATIKLYKCHAFLR